MKPKSAAEALVDYATVCSADDIRITFKHGLKIKA